ncbi:MAG: hypothetical protein GWN58_49060, partial [Anaerolineae bacterium]|nr:hypothetical protein [Anaerolineae bacterium]
MSVHRSIKWYHILIVCTLSLSTRAWALGVGEIQLHSHLGQPLNAEVQLTDTGD